MNNNLDSKELNQRIEDIIDKQYKEYKLLKIKIKENKLLKEDKYQKLLKL